MSTSFLYHTQHVSGFKHQRYLYLGDSVIQVITRKDFRCKHCNSSKVSKSVLRTKDIQGIKSGSKTHYFRVTVHRIYCPKCRKRETEEFSFLSHPKARITKSFERNIIELRSEMSISAISKYYDIDWRTIKNLEKKYLGKKFTRIPLSHVSTIGIDEIHVHKKADEEKGKDKFITVVRDLISGAVLFIGQGKSSDTLAPFQKKLKRAGAQIEFIAMDMSKAFTSWAENNHPKALIIYDHFHVIKRMNKTVNDVRKRICTELSKPAKHESDEEKIIRKEKAKGLKGKRFLPLYGEERLDDEKKKELELLRENYKDLGDATAIKEELRSIYRSNDAYEAESRLRSLIDTARETKVEEIVKVAKSIENHFDGIIAFWHSNRITSAAMEGFNNKIRWLIRQAYGFHDEDYFHLKIFDLPNLKTVKEV